MWNTRVTIAVMCCCMMVSASPFKMGEWENGRAGEWESGSRGLHPPFPHSPIPPFPRPAPRQRSGGIEQAKQLIETGSIDQAVALLRDVIRREPDQADAHLLLGTVLALAPERTEAIEALRRAVQLRPRFAPAYYTLGTVLARFAEFEAAIQVFEKAVELDPRLAGAHVSLALLLAQRKEFASARAHLTQTIELQGDAPEATYAHYLLARILGRVLR